MTLSTLARDAAEERSPAEPPANPTVIEAEFLAARVGPDGQPIRRAPRPPSASSTPSKVDQLTHFFPVEVLAFFLPGVGIVQAHFAPNSSFALLVFYACTLVVTPLIVWLLFAAQFRKAKKPVPNGVPIRQMFLGLLSFAVWGACVPGVFPSQQWWLGILAVVVAALMPKINLLLSP